MERENAEGVEKGLQQFTLEDAFFRLYDLLHRLEVGLEDRVFEAGGLDLQLKLFRLPNENTTRKISTSAAVPLHRGADNPIWIRVTTEDGYQAWSSPIYLARR